MSAPGGGEFKLGDAFVEVHLRDNTQDDERKIRQRWESSKPVKLSVEVDKDSATRAGQQAHREFQRAADREGPSLGVVLDRAATAHAGRSAAGAFRQGALASGDTKLGVEADRAASVREGRQAGESFERGANSAMGRAGRSSGDQFGRQVGLQIGQRVKLWAGIITAAAPVLGVAMGGALATMPVALAAAAGAMSPTVRASFRGLKDVALGEVSALGNETRMVWVRQMDIVSGSIRGFGRDLGRTVAEAEPGITRLTRSVTTMSGDVVGGMRNMLANSEPVFTGMGSFLESFGSGFENMGARLAAESEGIGSGFTTLGHVTERALDLITSFMVGGIRVIANNGPLIERTFDNIADTAENLASAFMGPLGNTTRFVVSALNGLLSVLGPLSNVLGGIGGTALGFLGIMRSIQRVTGMMPGAIGRATVQTAAYGGAMARAGANTLPMRAHMQAVRVEAGSMGRALSRADVVATTLGQRSGLLGNMQRSFDRGSQGAHRFARSAGVAAAGGAAVKFGAAGAAAALGGPFGIAIAGAVAGLALLGEIQQASADRMAEQEEQTKNWTQALIDSNGAIDGNVKTQVTMDLQQQKLGDGTTNLIQGFEKMGISADQVWKAVSQGGEPLKNIHDGLKKSADQSNALLNAGNPLTKLFPDLFNKTSQFADKTYELREALNRAAGQFKNARDNQKLYIESLNASYEGTTNFEATQLKLGESLKSFAESAGDSAKRGQALGVVYDQLHGGTLSLAGTQVTLHEAFNKMREAGDGFGNSVDGATGRIRAFTDKGAELYQLVMPMRDAFFSYADQLTQTGQSVDQVAGALGPMRANFVRTAIGMGMSKREARALADSLGLIPSKVATDVSMQGMPKWNQAVETIRGKILDVSQEGLTLGEGAKQAIPIFEGLGYTVKTLPGGEIRVEAHTEEGLRQLREMVDTVNTTSSWLPIGANTIPASKAMGALMVDINKSVGRPDIVPRVAKAYKQVGKFAADATAMVGRPILDARPKPANAVLSGWLKRASDAVGWSTMGARAQPAYGTLGGFLGAVARSSRNVRVGANGSFGDVLSYLNWISRQTAWVQVRAHYNPGSFGAKVFGHDGMVMPQRYASGGVEPGGSAMVVATSIMAEDGSMVGPDYYRRKAPRAMIQAEDGSYVPPSFYMADGGALTQAPRGLAAIDPPNSWRQRGAGVSGDRSDVDEFYIPDNRSPRSLALLDELVDRRNRESLRYLRLYAGGGVESAGRATPSGSGSPAAAQHVHHHYDIQATVDPTKLKTIEDMQRLFENLGRIARQGASNKIGAGR